MKNNNSASTRCALQNGGVSTPGRGADSEAVSAETEGSGFVQRSAPDHPQSPAGVRPQISERLGQRRVQEEQERNRPGRRSHDDHSSAQSSGGPEEISRLGWSLTGNQTEMFTIY